VAIENKGRSARLDYNGNTIVAAHESIRCLRDQIIVEPIGVEHSKILQVIEHKRPLRGIVKAVGPGHYPKRYDHPDKHKRTKMWDSRHFQPTEVKIGDIVELGMVDGDGYAFQTFLWGDKVHLVCREADVAGVESPESDGFGDNVYQLPRDQPTPIREGPDVQAQTQLA
jgi:hypothetical protein